MERERQPLPDEVLEGGPPPSEDELAELTRLEHPDATPITPELRRQQKAAAEKARREAHRRLGMDPQGELFPDR